MTKPSKALHGSTCIRIAKVHNFLFFDNIVLASNILNQRCGL